ncbi:hypothetical protein DF186_20010, partial [Enterococcus hirae]
GIAVGRDVETEYTLFPGHFLGRGYGKRRYCQTNQQDAQNGRGEAGHSVLPAEGALYETML